jgi:hypothetical protein
MDELQPFVNDDEFNSSDVEFTSAVNPFDRQGARAVEAILQNPRETRISTKIASKSLQISYGAPGTQIARAASQKV